MAIKAFGRKATKAFKSKGKRFLAKASCFGERSESPPLLQIVRRTQIVDDLA
jgi:hypothetical protein